MNTNKRELNLNEMENVNGALDMSHIITKVAFWFSNTFDSNTATEKKCEDEKKKPKSDDKFTRALKHLVTH